MIRQVPLVEPARATNTFDVANGSKAPFWTAADDFRSSLTSRPFQGPLACLKGANTVEKVENRAAPKIPRTSVLSCFCCCKPL